MHSAYYHVDEIKQSLRSLVDSSAQVQLQINEVSEVGYFKDAAHVIGLFSRPRST